MGHGRECESWQEATSRTANAKVNRRSAGWQVAWALKPRHHAMSLQWARQFSKQCARQAATNSRSEDIPEMDLGLQVAERASVLRAGFEGAIDAFTESMEQRVQASQWHGGVCALAQGMPGFARLVAVEHVKSRRSGEEYAGLGANVEADHFAGMSARRRDE
ncbi:unnamed protein product, partial [Prorocentrum cordatum]